MNTLVAQLWQWPPTSSTIYGIALLLALLSYMLTGSLEIAALVAGLAKIVLPQDAPAIDRALEQARTMEREVATQPKVSP